MKSIIKQIIIFLFAALIVFLLFYNCSSNKSGTETENVLPEKKQNTSQPGYMNECFKLYQEALKNDSIILAANEVNTEVANKAIKAFSDFSFYCKTDSLAPVYLLKAGQIAQSINNIPQAKISFEKVISDFPNYGNRGAAMFLLAQLYDEPQYLNNEEKARELYERIMSTFPNSEWARNALAARQLLGKTDEQIIQEFLKKNKKK